MSSLTNWVNETPERRRTYEQERLIVDVAEAVQGLLDKAGMKRAELGRRTGIARQSLHQMLSGQQNLTLRTMATIAHELGYRVSVSFEPYSAQETGTARLERIDQLMDANPGTPEGAELDRLTDEQVRSEADWLSRPAGGGVAEQPAPVGAASVAPHPTCSKCGAVVRVLEVETNGWIRLESHICRATANVEYP